jgi:hypothetical protein
MTGMDRRQFCTAGAALLAVGAAAAPAGSTALPKDAAFARAIFDSRFAASRAFARAAQRRGVAVMAIRGDVTALWQRDLKGYWARGGGAVAGLTTQTSLLCLEQMARDHWRQVCSRQVRADGLVSWVISA